MYLYIIIPVKQKNIGSELFSRFFIYCIHSYKIYIKQVYFKIINKKKD